MKRHGFESALLICPRTFSWDMGAVAAVGRGVEVKLDSRICSLVLRESTVDAGHFEIFDAALYDLRKRRLSCPIVSLPSSAELRPCVPSVPAKTFVPKAHVGFPALSASSTPLPVRSRETVAEDLQLRSRSVLL
jgi:hypothetical protein